MSGRTSFKLVVCIAINIWIWATNENTAVNTCITLMLFSNLLNLDHNNE